MKTILFFVMIIVTISSTAQQLPSILWPSTENQSAAFPTSLPNDEQFSFGKPKTKKRGGSIYMRYMDYVALQEGLSPIDVQNAYNINYLFPDSLMRFNPPNQGYGIIFKSIDQILHPQFPLITNWLNPNDIIITNNDSYTIDSVWVGGSYAKVTPSVDSMKMSLLHSGGNNLPIYFFSGMIPSNYSADTVFFALTSFTPSNYNSPHQTNAIGAPAAYVTQRPLDNTDSSGYLIGSSTFTTKYIGFNANNFQVPAGEIVSVSFTFLPGFSWSPGDTIGKNNKFLFGAYEPFGQATYMPYYNYNLSMSNFITKDSTGWPTWYIPSVAFNSPIFQPEILDIVYKISCTTCPNVSPTLLPEYSHLNKITLFPNPNTGGPSTLSISLEQPLKNIAFRVFNIHGQLMLNQNLTSLQDNKQLHALLDFSALPSGLYYYNLMLDEEKFSDKFTIIK